MTPSSATREHLHNEIFKHTLHLLREAQLLKGRRLAIDTSAMEANASLRSLEGRLTGEKYRAYGSDWRRLREWISVTSGAVTRSNLKEEHVVLTVDDNRAMS